MLTLGFTNHYYTLWSVTNSIRHGRGEVVNGVFTGEIYHVTSYNYLQNLSMDETAAKEKITLMAGEAGWEEDLSLRGQHGSFERTKKMIAAIPQHCFSFGKLTGCDMRTSEDAWQLKRAMREETSCRRRAHARRRLIELGELVRYTWIDNRLNETKWEVAVLNHYENDEQWKDAVDACRENITINYTTPKHAAYLEQRKAEAEMSGHFYQAGDRITLKLKEVSSHSFEGAYGTTFIKKYVDEKGRMFKYMGGSPANVSTEKFVVLTGTIQHTEYKGVKETKLQRIKLAK